MSSQNPAIVEILLPELQSVQLDFLTRIEELFSLLLPLPVQSIRISRWGPRKDQFRLKHSAAGA